MSRALTSAAEMQARSEGQLAELSRLRPLPSLLCLCEENPGARLFSLSGSIRPGICMLSSTHLYFPPSQNTNHHPVPLSPVTSPPTAEAEGAKQLLHSHHLSTRLQA